MQRWRAARSTSRRRGAAWRGRPAEVDRRAARRSAAQQLRSDNTTQNAITIFARDPDPGAHRLTPATAGSLDGSIVELVVLDHDRDGRDDLAAAVRTGTRGSIWIYLNRSPGDVAGP